ncbi:MAG: glycosyltransferase, partial [Anaerolineae bacterium]|nr:glycosyltransferase [Anaerolineae bacterium]
ADRAKLTAMQILLISRCPPYPLHLGDRLIVYHLARELSGRGHEIDLLAFYDHDEDATDEAQTPYAPLFRHVELIREPSRTPQDYVSRLLLPATRFPRNAESAWSSAMWRAIENRLAAQQYDAALVFGGIAVYEYVHALAGLPAIITPYESFSLYLKRLIAARSSALIGQLQVRAQRRLARVYESFMYTPYQRTVVVSAQDRDELLSIDPRLRVEVIPNGIDLDYFQMQTLEREPATLLFTGNYEYAPNVDAALLLARVVLPEVRLQMPEAKLWLVGNSPSQEMQALASDHIVVTGRVDDMRPYLARATLFVCPLRFGAGIKNKVLEALAMGCPVLASPLSVDGIDVHDGHELALAAPDAFAERVVHLLHDPSARQAFATHGRTLVETQYGWVPVAEAYEALFRKITT